MSGAARVPFVGEIDVRDGRDVAVRLFTALSRIQVEINRLDAKIDALRAELKSKGVL